MASKSAANEAVVASGPRPRGMESQPVSNVVWVPRYKVHANDYNPNKVYPPEMRLLKESIYEDGWTQPMVVRPLFPDLPIDHEDQRFEVVDGFHRWTTGDDPEIEEMTDGHVPVVLVSFDKDHQMASTIRHNRARGEHGVLKMAEIVRHLIDEEDRSVEYVMRFVGMEREEVNRLYDSGTLASKHAGDDFSKGWVPTE